ncbi:vWA domain-containing protein [Spongiivirga sp. MCCC 1A20706]|uniref:vWA domain-containing protein n=1 Tax=Spongiivirga sp. MCCC 1A20706 TaxID=3160963 RepID=UPI003977427A
MFTFTSCDWFKSDDDDDMMSNCANLEGNEFLVYEYFNAGSPNITTQPIEKSNNINSGNPSARLEGSNVVISVPGIRVRNSSTNFEVTEFLLDEDQDDCYQRQSEFNASDSSIKTDIAAVLVLDMSTSLQGIIDDLKSYAKEFASTIVNSSSNSQVAVIFFSQRDAIEMTGFYNRTNIQTLNGLIDDFDNYQPRTALFEATLQGIQLITSLNFEGEKSLVVFTDGGDNDSNNPSALQQQIQNSEVLRFTIGLRGDDFDEQDLSSITSNQNNLVVANTANDLQRIFRDVTKGVISVYELLYTRSDQQLNVNEKIRIRVQVKTRPI